MKKITSAFTLAEVLITLGVIGVVAAMTMPTLIKNYKAVVLRSQLNKAYTSFAQATQMILTQEFDNNPALFLHNDANTTELIKYYQKYMYKSVPCDRGANCSTTIFPQALNASFGGWVQTHYKTYNGNTSGPDCISDAAISLQDGTFAILDEGIYLTIDINGWKKAPNKFGHDFFMFQIVDGALKPMGTEGTNATYNVCSKTSTSIFNGRGCTAQALADKDYFKNLP